MKKFKTPFINILIVTISTLVFLAIGVGLIELFVEPAGIPVGWRSSASDNELNQLGYRGQPIEYSDDDYVVLLVGDSQVEANACCDLEALREQALQSALEVAYPDMSFKVFSLGAGGYGQDQQLLALREYTKGYRFDHVIVWVTPGNDVWNNTFPTHWPYNTTPKPTFWIEDGELEGLSEELGDLIHPPVAKVIRLLYSWLEIAQLPYDRDGEWIEQHLPPAYSLSNHAESPG